MVLFRSLTVGLLAACVWMLGMLLMQASQPALTVVATRAAAPNPAAIVDLAPGLDEVSRFVHLEPDEHVVAVGDRPVADNLAAGAAIAGAPRGPGRYIDLTIARGDDTRRVIMLLH